MAILPLPWRGSLRDPIAYLRQQRSSGIIVDCRRLSPGMRAHARGNGGFCCLGPPNW